ncbi:thioredoxin family protein [Flavobacterium sp. NKUCC04_CG]|uniref:thioredoxin family protein n=1 Tax=Flavobacterium sp. NKUCC04_CG TaxID=2842121 RepID=UPI001C5A8BA4|nr:thioredoxin family protein [Flavobacterium sp. NKUCC04_CG]MBW3519963.1 thioredoxin family protein [Flavobacterium sp. NKUCC04_CG]
MRKILISSALLVSVLLLSNCKKEVPSVEPTTTVEADTIIQVDTVAAKKAVEAEKETLSKPYNEQEDAQARLNELIAEAKIQGKNVFVQAGGNWCIWCLRFNDFVQNNQELKNLVDKNYLYYHLNYSTKNKNKAVFDKYAPDSKGLGYPFFFVINGEGVVTNIFASGDLEAGKSYDVEKVRQLFLSNISKK